MMTFQRTTSDNADFQFLTREFDNYLIDIDGDEKDFFAQYNQIYLEHVVVCNTNGKAIGCGAFKEYETHVAELKRMFVLPEARGNGIASSLITELESWITELKYTTCILETSNKLVNAIALYTKFGYQVIQNYGQYANVESSICMKKTLK
jgi:putative acetyltransferase